MWRGISAILLGLILPQEAPDSAAAVLLRADVSAVLRSWRFKGVMTCPRGPFVQTCLWVENAYPCGIIEIVQRPRWSQLAEALPLVSGIHGGGRHGERNLRFAEARVHTAVSRAPDFALPIARPIASAFMTNYVSELDLIGWRVPWWDLILKARWTPVVECERMPAQPGCARFWGPMYPRTGFVIHPSEAKSAFLQAVRAGRVASDPAGRVVLALYPFEPRPGHYLQMVRPVWRPAVPIGVPGPIDEGAGSLTGSYLFLHLGIFEECRGCLPPRLVGPR